MTAEWFGIVIEYRYTYVKPTWTLEGSKVTSTLGTNHFILGIGAHH